jgi:hypothetical protein
MTVRIKTHSIMIQHITVYNVLLNDANDVIILNVSMPGVIMLNVVAPVMRSLSDLNVQRKSTEILVQTTRV